MLIQKECIPSMTVHIEKNPLINEVHRAIDALAVGASHIDVAVHQDHVSVSAPDRPEDQRLFPLADHSPFDMGAALGAHIMPEGMTGTLRQPYRRSDSPVNLHTLFENALFQSHTSDGRFLCYLTAARPNTASPTTGTTGIPLTGQD